MDGNISAFSGPDQNYHVLANLVRADQVIVLQEANGWYKIKHSAGVGWVAAQAIQIV